MSPSTSSNAPSRAQDHHGATAAAPTGTRAEHAGTGQRLLDDRRRVRVAQAHGVVPVLTGFHQRPETLRLAVAHRCQRSRGPPVLLDTERRGGPHRIRLPGSHHGDVVVGARPTPPRSPGLRAVPAASPRRPGAARSPRATCAPTALSTMRFPMKAAARARPYGTPPTLWGAPVGQPTISRPAGNATGSATDAGRHRIGSTASAVPDTTAT